MRHLPSAATLREAAVDLLQILASVPRRRYFWLLVAVIAGYSFGYQDAFRGPESLGWRFGALVDRLTPASISAARRRNAEAIRQRVQQSVEVPQ
jgi:hypothetical protein